MIQKELYEKSVEIMRNATDKWSDGCLMVGNLDKVTYQIALEAIRMALQQAENCNISAVSNSVCDTCEKCGTPKYFNYKYGEYEDCNCSQTDC